MVARHLISDDMPPQMKILNTVTCITSVMYFCNFVSNWSVANRNKLHVIHRNVMQSMASNYFGQYIQDIL